MLILKAAVSVYKSLLGLLPDLGIRLELFNRRWLVAGLMRLAYLSLLGLFRW